MRIPNPPPLSRLGALLELQLQPPGAAPAVPNAPPNTAGAAGVPNMGAAPGAAGAAPQAGVEPPKDSIEGAVLGLLHSVIDGIVSATPRTMQVSSAVNRSTRPIQIQLRGRNSQGLYSLLTVRVDLDQTLQGLRADVRLQLFNQQQQPVANQQQSFGCRRNESVKGVVKQYGEWLSQAEALQMAPVAMNGQPVML